MADTAELWNTPGGAWLDGGSEWEFQDELQYVQCVHIHPFSSGQTPGRDCNSRAKTHRRPFFSSSGFSLMGLVVWQQLRRAFFVLLTWMERVWGLWVYSMSVSFGAFYWHRQKQNSCTQTHMVIYCTSFPKANNRKCKNYSSNGVPNRLQWLILWLYRRRRRTEVFWVNKCFF